MDSTLLFSSVKDVEPDTSMSAYFTGRVEIRKMVTEKATTEVETFLVSFFDGARTKLHYHETDQVLVATAGNGAVAAQTSVESVSETSATVKLGWMREMKAGDFVCIPSRTWHWHGAAKGQHFAHYQIKRPGKTVWLEE